MCKTPLRTEIAYTKTIFEEFENVLTHLFSM